jgi:alpha-1,3-mannosyltransferase
MAGRLLKVLHITTDFAPGTGGLERFVRELAVHSRSADIDPSMLCLNRIAGDNQRLPSRDEIDGIPVRRLAFLDLKYYKPVLLPMRTLGRADILHVHGIGAPLDFVAATRWIHRRPIVLSTHGGIFHTSDLLVLKNTYFALVRRLVLPRVDRVVACGEGDRRLFADHGVTNTITIDNGIDLRAFSAADGSCDRVANRMLFVGRIAPNKCVDHLIRTLAEVRRRGIPATLRIIGPDRYGLNDGLRTLADELDLADAVSIPGEVAETDLPREYNQADLFVSASRHEGFGLSTVEAMAGGAIPLLNHIPAFEYLLSAESASPGMLCDFADPSASADVTVKLLSSDRSAFRAAARARAADFSWDRIIPKWRKTYESV